MLMTFSPLSDVRKELSLVDQKIANLLGNFRAAKNPDKIDLTAKSITAVTFPNKIENLSMNRNTPRELFAGVKLFLALKTEGQKVISTRSCDRSAADKTKEFIKLCEALCERHDLSRRVYEYKRDNPEAEDVRKDSDGCVITFDQTQHQIVVERMAFESINQGLDSDLNAHIIDWIAAVNAGWQDMAINENKGPFVKSIKTDKPNEIRTPKEWSPL